MTADTASPETTRWARRLRLFGSLWIACVAASVAFVLLTEPSLMLRGAIAIVNIALLLAAGWSMMRLMEVKRSATTASSRYMRRMMMVSVIYIVGVFFAEWMFSNFSPAGLFAFAVALVPAAGVLGFIWAMGRYLLEEEDEYIRMRETQKFLVATGFMMVLVTLYGFFEQYELVPHIPLYFAFVVWCAGLGFASLIQWRRG